MPQRDRTRQTYNTLGGFHTGLIRLGMYGLTAQGVHVVVKHLLQVDQAALTRAVVPVRLRGAGPQVDL